MTVSNVPDRYGECADCDTPEGDIICRACANEEASIAIAEWLVRQKTVAPGITNSKVALIERLISDLEAG